MNQPLFAVGRGAPRKPTALKRLGGRVQRVNPREPQTDPAAIPSAPADLDPVSQECWQELRQLVNPLHVTSAQDVVAFKLLVDALATARRAACAIRAEGISLDEVGSKGQRTVKARPEVAALLGAQKLVWYGLSRFGLTPADRGRVSAPVEPGVNPEDEFAQ